MNDEKPFSSTGQSTGDEKGNDWTYYVDMLHSQTSCHNVGTRPTLSTKRQQRVCWQQNKLRGMFLD
jgi:hypothetical protein